MTFMSDRIGRKEEYNMYIATLNQFGIEVWTIKEGLLGTQEDTDRLTLLLNFGQMSESHAKRENV